MGDQASVGMGTARELPAGHLRGFEDETPADLSGLLAPRVVAPTGESGSDDRRRPAPTSGLDDSAVTDGEVGIRETTSRSKRTGEGRSARPKAPPSTKGPEDKIRASNVHIPVVLMDRIAAKKASANLSNGELVIAALEACHDRLSDLIGQRGPTGGSLFTARMTRGVRTSDGPLTAFNIRLLQRDYAVIDQLVEKHGAFSRGHLVTAALTEYLRPAG